NENYEAGFSFGSQITERNHFLFSLDHYTADGIDGFEGRNWYDNWGTVDIDGPGRPSVVAPDVRSRMYTAGGLIRLPGSALNMVHFTEGGVPRQFEDGDLVGETRQSGGTGFYGDIGSKAEDQGALGGLMPDTERTSVFMYLDHEFSPNWSGFAQYMYGNNQIN